MPYTHVEKATYLTEEGGVAFLRVKLELVVWILVY
jgi:hypothetical protein